MSKERFKILLLPRWYPNSIDPQLGVFIQKHARAIAQQHDVVVFYAQPDSQRHHDDSILEGVREYRYYYRSDSSFLAPVINAWRYFQCWRKFKKDISLYAENGFQPDIFHPYIFLRTVFIVWYEQLFHPIPYVYSEQWSGFLSGKVHEYSIIKQWLLRRMLNKATAVSAVSNVLANSIKAFSGRTQVQVIRNTVESADLTQKKINEGKTGIILVADLVDDIKNISDVIRSMKIISTENNAVELRIIGGGPDEKKLKQLANDLGLLNKGVFFEGRLSNEDVYEKLLSADFLVMNSRYETFSLICAEALSCGIPVIATRCGGPEEIVTEECGVLIPVNDITALTDAIRKMMVEHRQYRPEKLAEDAANRFSLHGAADAFSAFYQSAVKR